jgi:hypothetical protein
MMAKPECHRCLRTLSLMSPVYTPSPRALSFVERESMRAGEGSRRGSSVTLIQLLLSQSARHLSAAVEHSAGLIDIAYVDEP